MNGAKNCILEVKSVSKTFHSKWGKVEALQDVSFSCFAGEFVSIVGPSGCGKTTLLRIIAGLEEPSSGEVFFEGAKVSSPAHDRAVVFQEPRLFPWLTVEQNTALGLNSVKDRQEVRRITEEALKLVGLLKFKQAYPYELSGGMAQRVAIARALTFEPKILLLDEPFSALDSQTRSKMQLELHDLWQKTAKTIVLVTHDIEEAVVLSGRIMIMSPSPGSIKEELPLNLEYPRQRESREFKEIREFVRQNILI